MIAFIDKYIRGFIGRYYFLVTLFSVLLTALAAWTIVEKWNINSDFKAMLPPDSAAALAMEEVGDRVGSGSSLFVVIDSPDSSANIKFAETYAQKLREIPEIALAHFHNDKEFFEKNRLLYVEAEDLETLHDRIKKQIRDEKRKANPMFVSLRPQQSSSGALNTADLEEKYSSQVADDYKEYLISDDGYSLTIIVRFVETSTDLEATNRLLDQVRQVGQELNPTSFHPEMTLDFGGGLVNRQVEYTSIVNDIFDSAIFTVVGLFLIIAAYFRRFRAILLVLTPLVMGIVWTLALAFLYFGELTTVSVFIFVILLGLGISFSIHILNGYDYERDKGRDPLDSLVVCLNSVGRATTVGGAATTFGTFVVLSFAQFRGLSQFGQVASLGIVLTMVAMLTVLPALILTLQRIWPHEPKPLDERMSKFDLHRFINETTLGKAAPALLVVTSFITILAAFQLKNVTFEENFRQIGKVVAPWEHKKQQRAAELRTTERAAQQAARMIRSTAVGVRESLEPDTFVPDREQLSVGAKYSSALGGKMSSTPTILMFDDSEHTAQIYRLMNEKVNSGELKTISSVGAIHAFLPGSPEQQKERLAVIADIKETLDREDLSVLKGEDRKKIEEFREWLDVEEVTLSDLPDWTKRLFREAGPKAKPASEGEEFAFEYLIYVNENIDSMKGEDARRFLGEVQSFAETTGLDIRIGSQSYIYTAMLDEIKYDGGKMLSIALLVVFTMLLIFFRSLVRTLISMLPLIVGTIWMLGFSAWFGIKLDFFNVIVLPVIIGVGIDDGMHLYYQYLIRGRGHIVPAFHMVGAAITMTTVTSVIGFGGLAVTHYAGLQSIGYLSIVGLITTHLATVSIMPALLWMAEKRNWTWILPDT